MKTTLSTLLALFIIIVNLNAQEQQIENVKDSIQKLDEVIISTNTIFGNAYVAKHRTGSAHYIDTKTLKKHNYTNINRVLQSVPGVTFYEEDGFGLRPNISLRGTSPERSAKISLMEDGVLIAPAPYSSPSAYYFPSVARMQAVEILKGSSQVQYGPFTTGGAINMVSTAIPKHFEANIRSQYGSFNTRQLHTKIGSTHQQFGYLVEYLNYNSDGFKALNNNDNTGFNINDVVVKLSYSSKPNAKLKQRIETKFQYYDEISNETYLGLTETDFNTSPYSRYAASQNDNMQAEHLQYMATHTLDFSSKLRLTTQGYYNRFKRNWYKLDDVNFNSEKKKIADVVSNPNMYQNHLNILRGTINTNSDALLVKANNRVYNSYGAQTKFDYHFYGENTFHDIEIGLRYHYDEEDRYQWEDGYSITNGFMAKTSDGLRGAEGNRISSAKAFAAFAMYKLKYRNLTLTPGLRYENILLQRQNYGSNDPNRTGNNLSQRENKVSIFIPGIGFSYAFNKSNLLFGGVHKGFSPPSNQPNQKAEESINYELGTRFTFGSFKGELVGFYNDYSNLLGSDLAATGGTGNLDQFNAGEVKVNGIEVLLNYNLLTKHNSFSLPITLGYTYTNTEFLSSFGSTDDLWGQVTKGDELPYIPKHQFNISAAIEHNAFEINFNGRYNGAFRTQAGKGIILSEALVASNFIIDFSAKYYISKQVTLTGNIINLLDKTYAVASVPAGLRPGHPFGASLGLIFGF